MKTKMPVLAVVASLALTGCNSALMLGRTGDDLENTDTYLLCKAQQSPFASQAVFDAIRRRQIDCTVWAQAIAAQKAAMFNAGMSMMARPAPQPVQPAPAAPRMTQCSQLGPTVQCTTY